MFKFRFCPNCQQPIKLNNNLINCLNCRFHFYLNQPVATTIILENKNQEILFTKRKFPPKKDFWDLPGGFVEKKETAEEAIKRELKEELNIQIKKFKFLGTYIGFYPYKGINHYPLNLIFYGKITDDQIKNIIPADDVSQIKFFSKKDIPWKKLSFIDIEKGLKDYLKINQ